MFTHSGRFCSPPLCRRMSPPNGHSTPNNTESSPAGKRTEVEIVHVQDRSPITRNDDKNDANDEDVAAAAKSSSASKSGSGVDPLIALPANSSLASTASHNGVQQWGGLSLSLSAFSEADARSLELGKGDLTPMGSLRVSKEHQASSQLASPVSLDLPDRFSPHYAPSYAEDAAAKTSGIAKSGAQVSSSRGPLTPPPSSLMSMSAQKLSPSSDPPPFSEKNNPHIFPLLSRLDPVRFGYPALGPMRDLLPPQEDARRRLRAQRKLLLDLPDSAAVVVDDQHFASGPRRSLCIVDITIPLKCDDGSTLNVTSSASFDLASDLTLTPEQVAVRFAEEYNLDPDGFYDVLAQIDEQLGRFIERNRAVAPTTVDAAGLEKIKSGGGDITDLERKVCQVADSMHLIPAMKHAAKLEMRKREEEKSKKTKKRKSGGSAKGDDKSTGSKGKFKVPGTSPGHRGQPYPVCSSRDRFNIQRKHMSLCPSVPPSFKPTSHCHWCKSQKSNGCIVFACEHGMCAAHVNFNLGITLLDLKKYVAEDFSEDNKTTNPKTSGMLSHFLTGGCSKLQCPVCSYLCECEQCTKRLNRLAWMEANPEVGSGPADDKSPSRKRSKSNSGQKPPALRRSNTFEKEKRGSLSTCTKPVKQRERPSLGPDDIKSKSAKEEEASSAAQIEEDGNTDYCAKCGRAGDLLCCDVCPRAFHPQCMDGPDSVPDDFWKCHYCERDDKEPGHSVKPVDVSSLDPKPPAGYGTLISIVEKAMELDFGYAFSSPVDIEDYEGTIERKLDYSLIKTKLRLGEYLRVRKRLNPFEELDSKQKLVQDRPIATPEQVFDSALKDVFTIFLNCKRFNSEGSAIYRMAEVQEKLFKKMLATNLTGVLPEKSLQSVSLYAEKMNKERSEYFRLLKRMKEDVREKPAEWKKAFYILETSAKEEERVFADVDERCWRMYEKGKKGNSMVRIAAVDANTGHFLQMFSGKSFTIKQATNFNSTKKREDFMRKIRNLEIVHLWEHGAAGKTRGDKPREIFYIEIDFLKPMWIELQRVRLKGDGKKRSKNVNIDESST